MNFFTHCGFRLSWIFSVQPISRNLSCQESFICTMQNGFDFDITFTFNKFSPLRIICICEVHVITEAAEGSTFPTSMFVKFEGGISFEFSLFLENFLTHFSQWTFSTNWYIWRAHRKTKIKQFRNTPTYIYKLKKS